MFPQTVGNPEFIEDIGIPSGEVSDDEILGVLSGASPSQAAWGLVDLALEHGGRDNVTVLIVAVRDVIKSRKRRGLAGLLSRD